jgi:hypothetical protein
MPFMVGIFKGLDEFRMAPAATDILGRAAVPISINLG